MLRAFRVADDEAAVGYLATRNTPRFFVNVKPLLDAPDADLSRWIEAAGRDAVAIASQGLPVYGRLAPPLQPGFPWADPVGEAANDLLFAVHPHRFQFLSRMALAVAAGSHADASLAALLADWMKFTRTKPEFGYVSNLVVIERLLASDWALAFLAARPEKTQSASAILRILAQDIEFVWPRLGQSHPNNHLLLDRFAAWYIALRFEELLPVPANLATLADAWCAELACQTYDDGGGFEHSTHYHGVAAEMGAAYLLLAEANGHEVPVATRARVERMLKLQAALSGPDGHAPTFGNSSDDALFPLDGSQNRNAAALRELHRGLFAAHESGLNAAHPARERAYWMLGGRTAAATSQPLAPASIEFPQAGIVVFTERDETTRCVFRTGVMSGTRYFAGHVHEDALTVTLVHGGIPFLVDAGTYTYRRSGSNARWRDYFAGPRAHNGITIGDRNRYGALAGDFRSDAPLPQVTHRAGVMLPDLGFVEAAIAGAHTLPAAGRGVVHLPSIGFIVYDLIESSVADQPMELAFQWAPECTVDASGSTVTARRGNQAVLLACAAGVGPAKIVTGREHPTNGWVSRGYGQLTAAPQTLLPLVSGTTMTAVLVLCGDAPEEVSIECEREVIDGRAFRIERDGVIDVVLLNTDSAAAQVNGFGFTLRGRAAWIRLSQGKAAVRALEGESCRSTLYRLSNPRAEQDEEASR